MEKIVSQACLRNQQPILEALTPLLEHGGSVLELACGTGQHGVYFAQHLPHIQWQLSEHPEQVHASKAWLDDAQLTNIEAPLAIDISEVDWANSLPEFDYGFCANLLHFVSEQSATNIFKGMSQLLSPSGQFFCYGPINEHGFTSEGNQALDQWLKADINPLAGIKELEWLEQSAKQAGLILNNRLNLPANNVILVFLKG